MQLPYGDGTLSLRPLDLTAIPRGSRAARLPRLTARGSRSSGGTAPLVYHNARDPRRSPMVPTGTIRVRLAEAQEGNAALRQELAKLDARPDTTITSDKDRRLSIQLPPPEDPRRPDPVAVAARLAAVPGVSRVEPDFHVAMQAAPDPTVATSAASMQPQTCGNPPDWHLDDAPQGASAHHGAWVRSAWVELKQAGIPTPGVAAVQVALIDFGFTHSHADLDRGGPMTDHTFRVPPTDVTDQDRWHGTAVAGLAVANDNTQHACGVAPECTPLAITCDRDFSDSAILSWLDEADARGASVVNCSWRCDPQWWEMSEALREGIAQRARHGRGGRGLVIVFAAGNDSSALIDPSKPFRNDLARHEHVVAAGALTHDGMVANYSNFGREVLFAPSSTMGRWLHASDWTGGAGCFFGGTSGAAAIISGVAALVLSARSDLCAYCVRDILGVSARPVRQPSGTPTLHVPLVDAAEAVRRALHWSCSH